MSEQPEQQGLYCNDRAANSRSKILFVKALKIRAKRNALQKRAQKIHLRQFWLLLHLCLTLGFYMTNVLKVCNFQKRKLHLLHQNGEMQKWSKNLSPERSISVTKLCQKVRVLAQYICLRKLSICNTMYHE